MLLSGSDGAPGKRRFLLDYLGIHIWSRRWDSQCETMREPAGRSLLRLDTGSFLRDLGNKYVSWRWWEDLPSGLHAGCPVFVTTQGARRKLLGWEKTGEKDLHAKGQLCFLTFYFNLSHLSGLTHSEVKNDCFLVCVFRNLGCRDLNLCYFWHPPCKRRQMHLKVVVGSWACQSQQGLDTSHRALSIKLK